MLNCFVMTDHLFRCLARFLRPFSGTAMPNGGTTRTLSANGTLCQWHSVRHRASACSHTTHRPVSSDCQ